MRPMRPTAGLNPFLDATAGQMLARVAARFPDREAIVAADRRITYKELLRESERVARGLLALGIAKDDKVALWLPNRPAWLAVQQACGMIGAVAVALNTRYKARELAYILGQSDATTLILADHLGPVDFFETLNDVLPGLRDGEPGNLALPEFPMLKRVIVDAEDPYPGCLRLSDVLEAGDEPEWQAALERARAQDGPGQRAIAVLTLKFAPVKRAMPRVRLGPAGEAACRPPESRGEGAQGTAFVRPMRLAAWRLVMPMIRALPRAVMRRVRF